MVEVEWSGVKAGRVTRGLRGRGADVETLEVSVGGGLCGCLCGQEVDAACLHVWRDVLN